MALSLEADFADVFEWKEARIQRHWDEGRHIDDKLTVRAA